jgi:hypothetical protein
MDINTTDKEELNNVHPSLKGYFSAGIDTNPHGEQLIAQKDFYKMNLFNSDPYELDPNLSQRTEDFRSRPGKADYFKQGLMTGVSHAAELIGSIPGGFDRFYDWGRQTLGFKPTDDSIFDYAEDYLKDIAHNFEPNENFIKPEGYTENFWYGLGQALPTIISYLPFVRATQMAGRGLEAIQGIGRTAKFARGTGRFLQRGGGLPAGIAITDMTREIDDAKTFDIIKAGAYGYGTGLILNVANTLNILPRMAGLGGFGYLSAGWEANNDERLAAASVWGVLGVFGPLAEGKPVRRQLSDFEKKTKMLFGEMEKPTLAKEKVTELTQQIKDQRIQLEESPLGGKEYKQAKDNIDKLEKELITFERLASEASQNPVRNLAAEKMFQNEGIIKQHETLIKNSEKARKLQEENEKRLLEGKEQKPIPENLKDSIMSSETVAKHEKYVNDLKAEQVAFGKIVWTNNKYNEAIFGADRRPVELFKQDMYNKDGTPKYADMKETLLIDINPVKLSGPETFGALAKSNFVPAKFMNHPLVKYINDKIYIQRQKVDTLVEQIAYDPMFAANKFVAPGKEKGKGFGDYMLRLNSTAEVLRLAGMRKIKTDGGGLTLFTLLRLKDPKRAAKLVNAAYKIEIDKLVESKKMKEDYTTRVDQKTGELRTSKRELTESQIRRIDELRSTRTKDNKEAIDAEIANILGFDPFIPLKEGHFKYEVTTKELKEKYKFDDELVKIYRSLRGTVDKAVDHYNKRVTENKEDGAGYIEKIPNYFPHIFVGDFAIFLKKWKGDKKGYRPVSAPGAETKLSANALKDYFVKEFDAKDVTGTKFNNRQRGDSEYVVQIVKRERSQKGSEEFDAFNKLFERYELTDEAFLKYQEAVDKVRKATGFRKFSLQRQGVNGHLGSRLHAEQMFIKKVAKKFSERDLDSRQAADFETSILSYLQGGITAGERLAFNREFGTILNKPVVISDGMGGTKKTTLRKDHPVAAQMAEQLRANAFGELKPGPLVEKLSQLGSDYIGNSGLTRILGGANQVTLNAKLLFGNMRFLLSQVFQPYHMIAPKLFALQYQGFDKGKVAMSQIKAMRDIFFPNKEMKEVIEFMYKEGVVDQKFLNEAAADIQGLLGTTKLPKNMKDLYGRKVFDYSRFLKIVTLQDFAGKAEQVSRLNASLMFYNFFRSAGVEKKSAMEMAAYNANKYMVEYNYLEQPGVYGNRGIGAFGKPFGLFKTFQHNYLAQLADYAVQAKQGKGSAGLIGFFTQMVVSAGIFGMIGYESAERILRILSPTVQKFTGKPLPSLTELILTSDLPNTFKYGVPSSVLNVDLTATLAAPGVNLGDLVSVPALDYLGLNPLNGFATGRGRGVIPTGFNRIVTAIASDSEEEKREAHVQFLSALAPTSMQVFIEQYYQGLPIEYWKYWTPSKEFKDLHKVGKYGNIQRDPFKRGRGTVVRGYEEWFARVFSSVSLEEKEALKLVYVTTRLKKNLRDDISGYLTAGAKHLMTEGYVPLYIVKKLTDFGLTQNQIFERLTNRADLMNTTILDRMLKKTNAMQNNKRINSLRDMAISHGFDMQYK